MTSESARVVFAADDRNTRLAEALVELEDVLEPCRGRRAQRDDQAVGRRARGREVR